MIPILFNKDEKTFTSLGLGQMDATLVEVERERNGNYTLYAEVPFNSPQAKYLTKEMLIKADAGARTKWQTFKINRTIKDTNADVIKVYADHISMDTINDAMKPKVVIRQQTAEGALRQWANSLVSGKAYDVQSDITHVGSTEWTIDEVENARQALGGVSGSILDVWGGEYEFDNNRIILHKEMGRTAPTVLEYGRNIVSLEYEELIDGVYTSIYPYATYTPKSKDNKQLPDIMVTLDELIIDSEYAGNYETRRIQIVDFSGEFDSNAENPEIPTQAKLRTLAKAYVKNNGYGIPRISQEIDFVDLSKTLDYQDIQVMEEIELNDRVPVYYPNIDAETNDVKVTTTNWDVLNNRYSKITISTIGAMNSNSITSKLNTAIKDLKAEQKKINNTVPYLINGQGNRVWHTTPDDNMEHKIDDTWFKKNGKYTIIYRWNGSMWEEVLNDETFMTEIEAEVSNAVAEAEKAKALAINESENALAQAKADATAKANAIKEQISGEVNTAISTAEDAKALAVSEAEKALSQAKADATAKANAVKEEVSTSVNTAIETAETAKQTAIDNYNNAVAEAERLVGEQTTAFDTKFGEIEDGVSELNNSVSDADAKAEAIKQGLGLADITLTNQQITDQIRTDYNSVKQNANNALTDASKALTDAYNAQQDADKVIEDFETFLTSDFASVENDIITVQTTATDALNKAGTAVNDLDTFKIDYNTFITDQFNPAFTAAADALSLAERNEGLFYSANLIDEVTGQSNVYTKAEIDGTNGYVSKSAFTQNAESVSSELERVEGVALASGSNMNLLVRKDEQTGKYLDTGGVVKETPDYAISTHKINVTSGEKLTFSQNFARNFRYAFYKSDGTFLSFGMSASQKFTITVPTNASYMLPSYSTSENYPKIERGEVKTQWTLAPQDQVNQTTVNYLTSQIEQTAGKITEALIAYTPTNSLDDTVSSYLNNQSTKTAGAIETKLTSYAKSEDLNGLATETFATNKATETANGVKKELVEVIGTKVDEDTLDGYVSTATYDEGVKGISKSISTVEGKIPNFVGGKNLIPKSNGIKLIDYPNNQVETYANGFTKFLTSAIVSEVYTNKTYPIKPSTTYTASATVRTDGTMTNIGWNFYTTEVGSNIVTAKFKKLGADTYRIFATVTTRPKDANLRFPDITPIGIANATYYEIGEYQLELGEVATDWGLAISDLQTIASLDGNVKSLFTNTSSETSREIVRKLSAYTPTNNLDGTLATYLTNESSATAGAIENKLTSYAKSTDLTGLASETYATNTAVTEAGKVRNELTKYAKATDLTGLATETYAQTQATTEAGKVEQKLTGYAKSEDLNGLATETYATNIAVSEAGKVSNELTKYELKTGVDSKVSTLATALREETTEKMKTVYTKTETENLLGNKADNSALNNYVQQTTYESGIDGVKEIITSVRGNLGSPNLLKKSWHNDVKNPSIVNTNYNIAKWELDKPLVVGKTYTFRLFGFTNRKYFSLYTSNEMSILVDKMSNNDDSIIRKETTYNGLTNRNVWEKTFTLTQAQADNMTANIIKLYNFPSSGTTNGEVYWATLVEGNAGINWSPAFSEMMGKADFQIFETAYTKNDEAIKSRLTAIDSSEEGSVVTRLNATEKTASGNTTTISDIKTKPGEQITGYQTIVERSNLYERVIGTDEAGVKSNISRHVQASGIIQSEVASAVPNPNLLNGTDFKEGLGDIIVYNREPTLSETSYFPYGKVATIQTPETSGTANVGFAVKIPKKDTWYTLSFYGLTNFVGTNGVDFYSLNLKDSKNYKAPLIPGAPTKHKIQITVQVTQDNDLLYVRPQGNTFGAYSNIVFYGVKLEVGEIATPWENSDPASSSKITQLADSVDLKVSNEDLLSEINVQAGGVLIQSGTNKLNITPETTYIEDATIKSAMIHSIDVNKITGITADFTSMVTKGLTANVISANMIHGNDALFEKLFSNSMATKKLSAQEAWIKSANIVSLDAGKIKTGTIDSGRIDAKAIVTGGLDANVVKSTHIESSTGLIDKIFANEALITRLTSNSIFANKIKAIEIDASKITSGTIDSALIDAEYIVTNGLSTNVVESKHIKAETGLVDKIFSKTAYIEELTNKSIFTEKIQAININADKITSGTLDAGKVSVVNLDANNITANKTSFVQSAWNGINNTVSVNASGIRSANSNGDWTLYHSGAVSFGNSSSQGIYLEYADGSRNGLAINNRGATNTEITLDLVSSARNTINFGRRTDTNGYDFRIDHYQGTKVSFDGRGVQRYTFNVNSDAQSHAISILGHGATSGYNKGSGLSIGMETADGKSKGSRFYFSSTSDLVWLGKNSFSDLKPLAVFDLQFRWGENERKSLKAVLEYLSRAAGVDINNIPSV